MKYAVRVELNSGSMNDFNLLHQAMDNKGFSKIITSDDGRDYYLPKATYLINTTSNRSRVLEAVKSAVSITRKTAEIIVFEYSSSSWSGLTPVR